MHHHRIFDVISVFISLSDLITDIIILIIWYHNYYMVLFWIGICILVVADCAYAYCFYVEYHDKLYYISIICYVTILGPVLPFVVYLKNMIYVNKYQRHKDINVAVDDTENQSTESTLKEHKYFLLQALIESIPHSILQLTAIIYYNDQNIISTVSIILSISNICINLLILIIHDTKIMTYQSLKMKLFIWLSITVDVISFFFIISYAFHTPDTNNLKYYFKNIQTIYFYQFAITFLPLSVVLFIGFHLQITLGASFHKDCKCWIFRFFMWSLVFLIGVSIVLFVVLLLLQIFCASWILVMLVILGSIDKLPYQPYTIDSHKFYSKWIRWIVDECKDITDNNGNILLSSKQDMLIRLCLFNKIIMEETSSSYSMTIKDKKLISYLQIEQATYFKHVTFNSIRQNCTDVIDPEKLDNTGNEKPAPFWKAFWYSFYSWYLIEQKHNIKHDYFDGDFPV
eukprot:49599_1